MMTPLKTFAKHTVIGTAKDVRLALRFPAAVPATFLAFVLFAIGIARAADAAPRIGLKLLAEGFTAPIVLASLPDGSGRLLVADQAGAVYLLNRDGKRNEKPFLDLRSKIVVLHQGMDERGIVGFTLHQKFKENRRFYAVYSVPLRAGAPSDWDHTMRLSEFRVSDQDAAAAIPNSERVLLEIDEPDWNHNSGRIAFGPDGYLYWTLGDGGAPNDVGKGHAPEGNGQNLQTLLGKIVRIDVDKDTPYGIPSDNPYADGKNGRREIYAYGLRNPWGISFDRGGTHELFVADVGQDSWEELNIIVKGGNYGWRVREGFVAFDPKKPRDPPAAVPKAGADGKPFIDPILVYKNLQKFRRDPEGRGLSVTGGYVYRGKAFPQLIGKYVFADWSKSMAIGDGTLFVATRPQPGAASAQWTMEPLALAGQPDGKVRAFVWALGEDEEGELYVLTNGANLVSGTRGKVFKLAPL